MNGSGYAVIVGPWGEIQEMDTLKCNHCQFQIHLAPLNGTEPQWGHCKMCDDVVCATCYDKVMRGDGCAHFMRQIEEDEAAYQQMLREAHWL